MTRLWMWGLILILLGLLYGGYWLVTYRQSQAIVRMPRGSMTKEQFLQKYPNIYRAYRFFGVLPFEDYPDRPVSPGHFVPQRMRCHAFLGIALFFLGVSLLTFGSSHLRLKAIHYFAVASMGFSIGVALISNPHFAWMLRSGDI